MCYAHRSNILSDMVWITWLDVFTLIRFLNMIDNPTEVATIP